MTFEEFIATKRWSEDVETEIGFFWENEEPVCGFIYNDCYYILKHNDEEWYTIAERDEIIHTDLSKVEKWLWDAFCQNEINS